MNTYQLNLFQGHAIIRDGEHTILVDSGAPTTIHITDSLKFNGEQFHCTTNYMGLTVMELSGLLGTQITTLMGADILAQYHLLIDYRKEQLTFSSEQIQFDGQETLITTFMGIPIVEYAVAGDTMKFFLDTGAKLSYLSKEITQGFEGCGREEDFYPGVGNFETECFEIPTLLGDSRFSVKYGNLPDALQMALMVGGVKGIMGYDFFNNFTVNLDLAGGILKYKA